jgi:hypothetical protein
MPVSDRPSSFSKHPSSDFKYTGLEPMDKAPERISNQAT